jgi:hypothetical protein
MLMQYLDSRWIGSTARTPRLPRSAKVMSRGGDHDLGAAVAARQMYEVCDRLPAPVAQAALVRYGFVDAGIPSAGLAGFDPPSVA